MEPQTTPPSDAIEADDGATSSDLPPSEPPPRRVSSRHGLIAAIVVIALVGTAVIGLGVTRPWEGGSACPPAAAHSDWSVARRWDEALLDAIRRALPNPPVHARNLFHTSVAM